MVWVGLQLVLREVCGSLGWFVVVCGNLMVPYNISGLG